MAPKSASQLSLVEAIPLPALDPNPKQSRGAIGGGIGRANFTQRGEDREKITLNGREQP
jgi:hypothetical protein